MIRRNRLFVIFLHNVQKFFSEFFHFLGNTFVSITGNTHGDSIYITFRGRKFLYDINSQLSHLTMHIPNGHRNGLAGTDNTFFRLPIDTILILLQKTRMNQEVHGIAYISRRYFRIETLCDIQGLFRSSKKSRM